MFSAKNVLFVAAAATGAAATGVSCTPHDSYSSSVGVLGCKVNTDRIAYWPGSIGCDNICVKLTYGSRSVHLLRVDQSGGAHDISYDAWVYLQTGQSASADPIAGGGVAMEYEEAPASACADLLDNGKVPLSAANSMGYVAACLAEPSSYVAQNMVLYNIADAICSLGVDEVCTLDLATSNQPSCPHQLGLQTKLTTAPVYNVKYQTGKTVNAATGEEVAARPETGGSSGSSSSSSSSAQQQAPAAQVQQSTSSAAAAPVAPVAPKVEVASVAPTTTNPAPVPTTTKTPAGAVFVPSTSESSTSAAAAVQQSSSSSSHTSTSVLAAPTTTSHAAATSYPAVSVSKASSSSSSVVAYTTMAKVTTTRASNGTGSPSGVASSGTGAARPSTVPQGTPAVVSANAGEVVKMSSAALAIVAGAILAAF